MLRPSPNRKSSQNLNKLTTIVICFALLLSTTPLVAADSGLAIANWLVSASQDQRHEPRPGAPEGIFPNLDEMRRSSDEARRNGARMPNIPAPIPSTRRRWRAGLAAVENAQPSRNAYVDASKLLAYASAPANTERPSRTEPSSRPVSDAFGLFSASENAHGRDDVGSARSLRHPGPAVAALLSPPGSSGFAMARLAPQNRTGRPGVDLLSRNFNWNLNLVGLRGRSGLDLGLGLAYNSKVWTNFNNSLDFDLDRGAPGPGFRLGFPVVQGLYYNDQAGAYFYLLITPSGQRLELRRLGTSNVYQTVDASYAQPTDYGSYLIFRADGAQLRLVLSNDEYRCTEVKDRNGNYLSITYNGGGDILTVIDTLARVISFNYDANANLLSITQTWNGQTHFWATFGYGARYVGNNFPGLVSYGPTNIYINVLTQVGLSDGSRYNFEYSGFNLEVQQTVV
ncbi:MAG: RHS repeat domain-containing protein [Pyrinomonadaceae bacterium]